MPNEPMSDKPIFTWELKDASRDYWTITAVSRHTEESRTEPDFYETLWDVTIQTGACCCGDYTIKFIARTQYNEPIDLHDIVQQTHQDIMSLYDAALLRAGEDFGRRFPHDR